MTHHHREPSVSCMYEYEVRSEILKMFQNAVVREQASTINNAFIFQTDSQGKVSHDTPEFPHGSANLPSGAGIV